MFTRIRDFFWRKTPVVTTNRFRSYVDDLVLGVDFAQYEYDAPNGEKWIAFNLTRGRFRGVKFKYNSFAINGKSGDDITMQMDYDILENPTPFTKEELIADANFVNTVFNVAYAIIGTNLDKTEDEVDDTGRNDSGEPDSK